MATDSMNKKKSWTENITWYDARYIVPATNDRVLAVSQRTADTTPCVQYLEYCPKLQKWNVTEKQQDSEITDVRFWSDMIPPQIEEEDNDEK